MLDDSCSCWLLHCNQVVCLQCVDTAVFMGLVQQALQLPQQLQTLHHAADEQLSSRQSSASDVSAVDSPTHVDIASQPAADSTVPV